MRRLNQMKMNRSLLDQSVPKSILTYYRQAMTVLSMAVIAVVFIVVFRPFNIYDSLDFIIHGSLVGLTLQRTPSSLR